jgi:hypothetical protein
MPPTPVQRCAGGGASPGAASGARRFVALINRLSRVTIQRSPGPSVLPVLWSSRLIRSIEQSVTRFLELWHRGRLQSFTFLPLRTPLSDRIWLMGVAGLIAIATNSILTALFGRPTGLVSWIVRGLAAAVAVLFLTRPAAVAAAWRSRCTNR